MSRLSGSVIEMSQINGAPVSMTASGDGEAWSLSLLVWGIFCAAMVAQQGVPTEAYQISVDKAECVSEFVAHDGESLSGTVVVVGKQFDWYSDKYDVEMVITGPGGERMMSAKVSVEHKFHFQALTKGFYKICFLNPTSGPEKVELAFHADAVKGLVGVAKHDHFSPVEDLLVRLREAVEKVSLEQRYYMARETRHRAYHESTDTRLLWYTVAEYFALVAASAAQVYFVRRLFSVKCGR